MQLAMRHEIVEHAPRLMAGDLELREGIRVHLREPDETEHRVQGIHLALRQLPQEILLTKLSRCQSVARHRCLALPIERVEETMLHASEFGRRTRRDRAVRRSGSLDLSCSPERLLGEDS